ncbi:hypothetical protein K443DRAFT_5866 [Laccaria amethystina LaAM-08-1]|jgi:hypothetical protein|uniref:Uncharacterized protein n=1 Tax=Laccaria amethystina LaAM-08-1 TaxID=1095629 RepID=A0A0C9Y3M7_9AGAR|nr:hypothetical protein K443DRAFT_5866 [Laccaria amethystina LaAM-08-1]
MSIAGTSIFRLEEGYEGSTSFVSCVDGSYLGTKTSFIPSVPMVTEVVESTLSQFQPRENSHHISIPNSYLLADGDSTIIRHSLNAINQSIARNQGLPGFHEEYPVTHGEAYCGTLPHDESVIYVMFLDFCPTYIASETLVSMFYDGERKTRKIRKSVVAPIQDISIEDAINRVAVFACEPPLHRIVLNNPPPSLTQLVQAVLSENYPEIPVISASASDVSQALANYQYLKSCLQGTQWRQTSAVYIPLPICIASPTGVAIPLENRPGGSRCLQERIFTSSVDNQATATVRLLLGDHPLAKDNLERGVVILEGLKPMPKGVARIKVSVDMFFQKAFLDMITMMVEQLADDEETAPPLVSKRFIFPHFFRDVMMWDERYSYDLEHEYDEAQPELPA